MNKDRSLSPNVLPNEHPDFVLNFVMSVTGISTVSAQVGRAIFPVLYSISTKVSSVGMLSGEFPIRRKLASHNFNAPDAPDNPVLWLSSRPTQNTASLLSSNPANQLSLLSLVVPVLPATPDLANDENRPVPLRIVSSRLRFSVLEITGLMVCFRTIE